MPATVVTSEPMNLPSKIELPGKGSLISLRAAHANGWQHPHTLRRYIRNGELPAVKVGKQFMVREEDLERLIRPVFADGGGDRADRVQDEKVRLDDLASLAAQMVFTWPRLGEEKKAELRRLLAAAA